MNTIIILFFLIYSTVFCKTNDIFESNSIEVSNSSDIRIDIIEDMEKEFEILPENSYVINIKNSSLAIFIRSPVEDLIHYPSNTTCTKMCGVKHADVKYMYVNHFKQLKEKVKINITAVVNDATIISEKYDSPKTSKIRRINTKLINLIQVSKKNYFYADSYDNYVKIYLVEYDEGISISDILNINTDYFHEIHGKILELDPDKIYVIISNGKASFEKIYLHDEFPEKKDFANGDKTILYLEKGKEYEFFFERNTISFLIRLNEVKDSILDIENDSGKKMTLNSTNRYYNPMDETDKIYKGNIKINNIQNENALIEIIYSFGDKETEVLNDRAVTDKEISKYVTLVEYSLENEEKNMEIYIKSDKNFKIAAYAGLSQDNYFYYSSSNLPQISAKNYFIKLNNPLNNYGDLENNEKYKVAIIIEKTNKDQKVNITYYYNKNPIDDLYEELDKEYIDNVISNLTSIINAYAYTEIAQNPPQPEGLPNYNHDPIDIIGSLNNMTREGRKFYEFYREMREILGSVRDLHFRIFGGSTPSGIKLNQITACLPFKFYVEKDEKDDKVKMYVKYYEECGAFFSEKERDFVKEKSDNKTALKSINNEDPFDYIQKWGRIYRGNKSPHAHFTLMKTVIYAFYIRLYPYTPEELSMTFEFEANEKGKENDVINLDYFIFVPNVQNMKLFHGFDNFNKNDFDTFFENELKKNKNNVIEPNIFEMIHKYKVFKGIIKETSKAKSTVIDWKYKTPEENGIRCRVDEENQVNVFVQESFSIEDKTAQEVMYNCMKDFYQNDYRIIGIQNRNGGGWAHLCLIFHQLVQIKTQDRAFKAAKLTEFFKNHVLNDYEEYVDVNTCKPFHNIDELFEEIIDDFSTKDKKLLHHRSQVFNYIDKDTRKKLRDIREELIGFGHTKKPTDIIIYTDSFAYSATSSFVKGFQYSGGAIVVGFNGNPYKGIEEFDGSQSPASVTSFDFSDEYKNLDKLGIVVSGITFAETYDDYYVEKNPFPREYLLDPVDERAEIYEPYTDDTYQKFINEAKKIFKKYNEDGECNTKNKKILLDPNNGVDCYKFDDDEFAHGGYLCGDDGKWTNTCKKYYCDIGYYFNQHNQTCERDICANDPGEIDIYLNGEYNDTIILNKDNNLEYIFHINNTDYIYFFESDNGTGYIHYGYNSSCPNFCVVQKDGDFHKNKVHLNYNRNASDQNIIIIITSMIGYEGKITSYKYVNETSSTIEPINSSKSIYIIESFFDYVSFMKVFDDTMSVKCAIYSKEMEKSDILDVNEKYFSNCDGQINEMELNTIYIFAFLSNYYYNLPIKILFQPIIPMGEIKIIQDSTYYLYLSSNQIYTIDFSQNQYRRNIELSRLTIDSEVSIIDDQTGEEVKINKDNLYYTFNDMETAFTGKLYMKVNNNVNALIEFLFAYTESNAEILIDSEYTNYNITKKYTIIKFDKNIKNKNVTLSIFSNNEKEFKLSMNYGYAKTPYFHFSKYNKASDMKYNYSSYDLILFNEDVPLEKDESFYLVLMFDEKELISDDYNISLTKLNKYSIDDFDVDFPEENCKIVVDNVKKLMEDGYIYTDIIQNPPNPDYFGTVNLTSDLNEVETKNRTFYEFFRDIRRILGKMKDGHLNIIASKSPNGYDLKKMTMCLPFSFVIKGETPEEAKLYIEKYEDCLKFYNITVKKFVESHLDKPLIYINGDEPFNFIQDLQLEFNAIHNRHGQFTRNMNVAHKISINRNPLTKEQFSNIEFTFEDDSIILDYYLYYINPDLENNIEFMEFYNDEIKKEINTLEEISILDIENKFYKINNDYNNIIINNDINWDYSTNNSDGIQCRVDDINEVNVFKQKTFNFINKEYDEALEVINNCTEAFYSNSYPIIGIESNNGGGIIEVSLYFQQFLQVKILQRTHFSAKISDLVKHEIENDKENEYIDYKTCKKFEKFEEMKEIVDDYGKDILHHRTKPFGLFNSTILKQHKKRRQKYFDNYKLKRPTDIIIFTDSYSYSSTSFFIKGLQETGAAISVGYKGNPIIPDFFEASHSPSAVVSFNGSDIYNNLLDNGFEIIGTTYFESFNYTYQKENPIPREYLIHPVDVRVNIYQNYDDSLYDKFVSEAKKIFKKFNEENFCNKDNLKLLYDPNNKKDCYTFENDPYAHGGYECDPLTEKWSNICKPYYCDIGYYFDVYQNKCIKDICTEQSDDEPEDDSFPVWAIVLISIILVIILAVVALFVFRYIKRNQNRISENPLLDSNVKSSTNALTDKNE